MKILFAVFFFFIGKSFVSQYNMQVENFFFPIITLVCLFGCSLFVQLASRRIFRYDVHQRICILFRSFCCILSRLLNSVQLHYFVSKRWLAETENQETSFREPKKNIMILTQSYFSKFNWRQILQMVVSVIRHLNNGPKTANYKQICNNFIPATHWTVSISKSDICSCVQFWTPHWCYHGNWNNSAVKIYRAKLQYPDFIPSVTPQLEQPVV